MRLEPKAVQVIGNDLAVSWNDDTETFIALEFLRYNCPCAACGGEPDVLGNVDRPHVTYVAESFEMVRFDVVGGYAIQPKWRDGHNTGIYTFQLLRRLGAVNAEGRSS